MPPRFFVDENDLALGKALDAHHGGVVYPGHPELLDVPRGSLDDEWLTVIGARGLVVITRDKRIRYRPAERPLGSNIERGFVLTGRTSQSTAASVRLLDRHWLKMSDVIEDEPLGPWMRSVTEAAVRRVALD